MTLALERTCKIAYQGIAKPLLFRVAPDSAHSGMIAAGAWGQGVRPLMWFMHESLRYEHPSLTTHALGLDLRNPIGLSAGFDKNVEIAQCLANVGFGFATFGSMTVGASDGNPRPWFHRLPQYGSLVVHAGLPNEGIAQIAPRLAAAHASGRMPVSASVARTNDPAASGSIQDGIDDYLAGIRGVVGQSSLIEINISCPNTYNGEPFTEPGPLDQLLSAVDELPHPGQAITLKMPADKTWEEFRTLLEVAAAHGIDGVTIANLRKSRHGVRMPDDWQGNLSGAPARARSNELIAATYRDFGDRLTVLGVGGVFNAAQAYEKIRLGASLVELVTALMFKGPQVVAEIKRGLVRLLERDGLASISEAVGADVEDAVWR